MKNYMKELVAVALFACTGVANSAIITSGGFADDAAFSSSTGAVSLTGAIPNLTGSQGTSVTLGDATLSAGNSIFVGSGWSSLMPGGNAIAISGPENVDIAINTGDATAFGFYFHEPQSSTGTSNGCNVGVCVDSTFRIDFLKDGSVIGSTNFLPDNDVLVFESYLSDMVFDAVAFTETIGSNDNEFFGEMYVVRATVPEPASLALLGLGLAVIGLGRRRRN